MGVHRSPSSRASPKVRDKSPRENLQKSVKRVIVTVRAAHGFETRLQLQQRTAIQAQLSSDNRKISKLRVVASDDSLRDALGASYVETARAFREEAYGLSSSAEVKPQAQIEAFFTQPLSDRTALDVKLRSLEAEWESLAVSGAELRSFCFAKTTAISATWASQLTRALGCSDDARSQLAVKVTPLYNAFIKLCGKKGPLKVADLVDFASALEGGPPPWVEV